MRFLRSERGATLAEVAIILPVLLIALMVIMEGGRVLSVWMILTHSTRETARYVIAGQQQTNAENSCTSNNNVNWTCVHTALANAATTYEQTLIGNMLSATPLVVTPTFGTDAVGAVVYVTVSASYPVNTITPMMQVLVPTFNVSTTATMRAEA